MTVFNRFILAVVLVTTALGVNSPLLTIIFGMICLTAALMPARMQS